MKGFGLRGAALVGAIAFSLAAPALAGGFAWSAHPAHAPGAERIRLKLSPSHRDKRAGRSRIGARRAGLCDERYGVRRAVSDPGSRSLKRPIFFYPLPGYVPHFAVAERHGPRIIYIGRDEAPPSPAVGPKIIYGDEAGVDQQRRHGDYGDH